MRFRFVLVWDGRAVHGLDAGGAAPAGAEPLLEPEPRGGTVYLCVVDGDGMAVSLVQSLYGNFGSGVLVPGTGIVLNNRASCFIQAQAHVQLVSAVVDRWLDPQAALDEPRFRLDEGSVRLEEGLWARAGDYEALGARVVLDGDRLGFGGGQMIQVADGRILGGSDPRKDGFAAGF